MESRTVTPVSSFFDLLLDAVCAVDVEGRFVFVSAACERIFGYTPAELIGTSMIELVLPADRERTLNAAAQIMAGEPKPHFENRYVRKDGQVVHIMWSARWSEVDQLRIAVARDITELKLAEAKQAALYAISEAAHATEDLLALFERVHQIVGEWLPAQSFCVALYDGARDQLSFPYHMDDRRTPCNVDGHCAQIVRSGQPLLYNEAEAPCLGVPLASQNGIIGALLARSSAGERYTGHDQDLLQFVSAQVAAAIERKQLHARLQYMARYDQLTHLPNRGFLQERLKAALSRARREHRQLALLYVDLDKFKQVNDNFGHAVGDLLLQEVARRLQQCVRETDTVARIGGDEFVILLEQLHPGESAAQVADKIRSLLNEPMVWDECELSIMPSIGIALYPENGEEAQQLFKHADEAMYGVKRGVRVH
ncbi:GGDEF domain-containing protein [Pseudomonas asplenii]|uniref:GGDEF domain-containing protein n=1 Tax=Pseudomonas asplenii TaxID=53407 RepID=UPI0006B57D24|nr:GGDEF domain-containing protein [Pseudomonas fuscovaginae]KPA96854.1 PAS domain S-box/diguanylate cyclase (GGDEF) domain-containing protein [Pseudomonas fuscovaginae]